VSYLTIALSLLMTWNDLQNHSATGTENPSAANISTNAAYMYVTYEVDSSVCELY